MITLPITCRNIQYIIVGIVTTIGVICLLFPSPYWQAGIVILGVEGLLLGILGFINLIIWLDEHVKCKCDK